MNRLLWLSVLLFAASWLLFLPLFTHPNYLYGVLLLILGLLVAVFSCWKTQLFTFSAKHSIAVIPLLLALLVIPFPYTVGLYLIVGAFLLGLLKSIFPHTLKIDRFIAASLLSGIIYTFQAAFLPFYSVLASHGHRFDVLSPFVSWCTSLFGVSSSVSQGIVFIQTTQATYPFVTTLEKLGFFLWFQILVGFLLFLILYCRKRNILRSILVFAVLGFFYCILRYVVYIFAYINAQDVSLFWNPWYMLLGFLPFMLLCMRFLPLEGSSLDGSFFKTLIINKRKMASLILLFLSVFCLVGSFLFYDPGCQKDGRVIIDEYHSEWENTTRPLDTEWYGMLSTYNYYSWADWLGHYYTLDQNLNFSLTTNLLENYDILILKCPTLYYTDEEIFAILDFVEEGGGLFLIGDHTDVFGMNTFLNQIAVHFGLYFRTDATYELGTGRMTVFSPEQWFAHPIMQHVDHFEFMTSCTLDAPLTSENVMIGSQVISEPGTYSTENFFRESLASVESEYGLLVQTAAVKYGKGRVVAFSDSTVFSSFSIFTDGYQAFSLGALDYLNRSNVYSYVNPVLMGLAILSFLLGILLFQKRNLHLLLTLVVIGALASASSIVVFSSLTKNTYGLPALQSDYTSVCFDQEHSSFTVSVQPSLLLSDEQNNYGTFYVWTQRLGVIPSIESKLSSCLSKADSIVIINPNQPFSHTEITNIRHFIDAGGRVLVMDSILNADSTANDLLSSFGLWLTQSQKQVSVVEYENDTITNTTIGNITVPYLTISGGEPVLVHDLNETYVHMIESINESTGAVGRLVVCVDAAAFTDATMGGTFVEPVESQVALYQTEYYLFEELLLKE